MTIDGESFVLSQQGKPYMFSKGVFAKNFG